MGSGRFKSIQCVAQDAMCPSLTGGESEDEDVLHRDQREMQERGEGGAIYVSKDELEEYGFQPGQEVDVQYVIQDGSIALEVNADTPGGFTEEELLDFATEQGWTRQASVTANGEWTYKFEDQTGTVSIEVDSRLKVGEELLDNVSVVGPAVTLTPDLDRFQALGEAAREDRKCRVEVYDSDGIWERFKGSSAEQELPDRDAVQQLVKKVDTVTARLVATRPSALTSLDELQELVETIHDQTSNIEE